MAPTRRRVLHIAGASLGTAFAGCSIPGALGRDESTREYTLHIESVEASPTEYALYEPDEGGLFGDPARTALAAVLPDGRYTTYGYRPVPDDAYVEHGGSYYQTTYTVTGRKEMERPHVRVERLPSEQVPEETALIEALAQPSARPLKILHSHAHTDGETSTSDLLDGDAYVMRRPAELNSRLVMGDLDGSVVTMTEQGTWAYRVHVTREPIVETAHTVLAIEVASSRDQFRDVVFGSRIDTELAPSDLSQNSQDIVTQAIARETYSETAPLSESFDEVLDVLGLGAVDTGTTGNVLWYDDSLYRYALYINESS